MLDNQPVTDAGESEAEKPLTFGDTLHDALVRTIGKDPSPGLLLLPYPTGVGKSYAVERTIATLAARTPVGSPPVVFATPQKKNIPSVGTIEQLCRAEGYKPGPHDIQRLLSVPEMLSEAICREDMLGSIPRTFREHTNIDELVGAIRLYRDGGSDRSIRMLLPEFKRSLRKELSKSGWGDLDLAGRIELLEQNEEMRWIADLWPAVFTRRARVLLMTTSKLFRTHDTLLEPPCRIDEADWLRGSVLFVDEFDSAKADALSAVIDESVMGTADLSGLVRSMNAGVDITRIPSALLSGKAKESVGRSIGDLRRILDETIEATHADLVYKAEEGLLESPGLFMYDGCRRGSSFGATYRTRTDASRHENVIVAKGAYGDGSRQLSHDAAKLRGAVRYAQKVMASILRARHGYDLAGLDGEAVDNEILSLLEAVGIRGRDEVRLMLAGARGVLAGETAGVGSLSEGPTVYEQGFGLVEVEDAEAHRYSTHLRAYAMDATPESRLRSLVRRALVVGVSATATVRSPLCNFDLEWLEGVEPGCLRRLEGRDEERLRLAYERQTSGYERVSIRVDVVAAQDPGDGACQREAAKIVRRESLRAKVENLLSGTRGQLPGDGRDSNAAMRYARVAQAYRHFLEQVSEGVFLCVTTAAPRSAQGASSGYTTGTLDELFELVRRDQGVSEEAGRVGFIEGSDGFQERYDSIVSQIGPDCPRLFVCASYHSIATGVNLQYRADFMEVVKVRDFDHDGLVDVVGVYLDRITNLAPSRHRIGVDSRPKDVLRCVFEFREMAWHGDVSVDEMDLAVGRLASGKDAYTKLVDKPCVTAGGTRMAVQMVGRMCRTARKAPVIHLLIDEDLARRIDPSAMDDSLMGRETEALLDKVAELSQVKEAPKGKRANRLAMQGITTAGWLSSLADRNSWTKREMDMWEQLREWCLSHPTAAADDLAATPSMRPFYVRVGEGPSTYWYSSTNDFSTLGVTFSGGDPDYPLEASAHGARLDVLARVPEARRLFERMGWPLDWGQLGYVMNPALFQNVYLGAIGERVGRELLERRMPGLSLSAIEDPGKFEKFDYVIEGTGVYVDFKYWRAPHASGAREYLNWIRKKMGKVGATQVLVANLLAGDSMGDKRCEEIEGGILSVPYLIDDAQSCVAEENVARIGAWLRDAGVLR